MRDCFLSYRMVKAGDACHGNSLTLCILFLPEIKEVNDRDSF